MSQLVPQLKLRDISSAEQLNNIFPSDMPALAQRVLMARGVGSIVDIGQKLSDMPAPKGMLGVDQAASLLADAVQQQKRLVIIGDFDADGATSCALAIKVLRAFGMQHVQYLVPNRFDFGYGLSPEIVDVAMEMQPHLLMTVDNGIASVAGVLRAKQLGLDVIVTDHHLPGDELPLADAIVNPNQAGCQFGDGSLAGVGVLFYVLAVLRGLLAQRGWFQQLNIAPPNMSQWLDLVALGTVADLVPLRRTNRILVHQGLKLIRSGRGGPGIRALLEVAGKDWRQVYASDLGFTVGPRVNAAGRLDDIATGIECLLTSNEQQARELAADLHAINADRRAIQQQMTHEAERILSEINSEAAANFSGVALFHPEWHQGVVGLVASKIKEQLHRPTIVFALEHSDNPNADLKGSARSIPGLHIRDILDEVSKKYPDLIIKFGGHAMAAGLSIARDNFEQFCHAFDEIVNLHLLPEHLEQICWSDGELDAEDFSVETANMLANLCVWGQSIEEPRFHGQFCITQARLLKDAHLKLVLESDSGQLCDAIWFYIPPHMIDAYHQGLQDTVVTLYFSMQVNEFRGARNLQLMVHQCWID